MPRPSTRQLTYVRDLIEMSMEQRLVGISAEGIFDPTAFQKLTQFGVMDLCKDHEQAYDYREQKMSSTVRGISSIDFHMWLADNIRRVDKDFTYETKLCVDNQIREIARAVRAWGEAR